jgi:hypothetical protein
MVGFCRGPRWACQGLSVAQRVRRATQPATHFVTTLKMSAAAITNQIGPNTTPKRHLKGISCRRSSQGPFAPASPGHQCVELPSSLVVGIFSNGIRGEKLTARISQVKCPGSLRLVNSFTSFAWRAFANSRSDNLARPSDNDYDIPRTEVPVDKPVSVQGDQN